MSCFFQCFTIVKITKNTVGDEIVIADNIVYTIKSIIRTA